MNTLESRHGARSHNNLADYDSSVNSANHASGGVESASQNMYFKLRLSGSPHELEERFEQEENEAKLKSAAVASGKIALLETIESKPSEVKELSSTDFGRTLSLSSRSEAYEHSDDAKDHSPTDERSRPKDKSTDETDGGEGSPPKPPEAPPSGGDEEDEDDIDHDDIPAEILDQAKKAKLSINFLRQARINPNVARILREKYKIDWGAQLPDAVVDLPVVEISPEQIRAAEKLHGITITDEYIEHARRNGHAAEFLRTLGIDTGVPGPNPLDPVVGLSKQGRERTAEVNKLISIIESDPGWLRKNIHRPGELPLGLHRIPLLGRPLGMRAHAWRMVRHERKKRSVKIEGLRARQAELATLESLTPQQQEERVNISRQILDLQDHEHYDGFWRIGLPRYRFFLDHITGLDNELVSQRRKLSIGDRHRFQGPERATARRDLAQLIYRGLKQSEAIENLEILPDDTYVHSDFKDSNKSYQESIKSQSSKAKR